MTFFHNKLYHFINSVSLSAISITFVGGCLIILALTALYFLFFKPKSYEKYMPWIGIAVRILLFVGFALEFGHHLKIGPLLGSEDRQEYTVAQLSNYLLYSYVFVIAIYDLLTIGINKFRGFFHSFDIAMVSFPLIYTLTAIVIDIFRGRVLGVQLMLLVVLALLILMILMIYLFYQLYWKQSAKWYVIFFIVAIPVVAGVTIIKFKYPHVLPIFLFLLGIYEGLRKLLVHLKTKSSEKAWKRVRYSSTAFILIIMILGLNLYGVTLFKGIGNYRAQMVFKKEIKADTSKEAEKAAKFVLGGYLNAMSGISSDIYSCNEGYGFNEFYGVSFSQYRKGDIRISKNKALSLVADKYKFFGIYFKKAMLIEEMQANSEKKPKWMVMVIPYRSTESHIYFVDAKTGDVIDIQSYKKVKVLNGLLRVTCERDQTFLSYSVSRVEGGIKHEQGN